MKLRYAKLLLASSLLLFACGLFGGEPESVENGPPNTPPGPGDPLPNQPFSVNQSFWHSGFRVQLGEGRFFATEDEIFEDINYFVSIAASFENLGGFDTSFNGSVVLLTPGGSFPALLGPGLPTVPTGLSASGEFLFAVGADFDLASAGLLIGASGENRAQVPLGAQGGELITLEPSEPALSGEISLELIDLRFTSAELRADRPVSNSQVEAGKLALTLYFDATSRNSGNWNINAQDFALILPNGSGVAPEGSDLGSLPGAEGGIETTGLYVRFLVDDPPAGTYTLRFTPGSWYVGEDGVTEATFEFTLE